MAFEPIAVDIHASLGIADELNRMSEGLTAIPDDNAQHSTMTLVVTSSPAGGPAKSASSGERVTAEPNGGPTHSSFPHEVGTQRASAVPVATDIDLELDLFSPICTFPVDRSVATNPNRAGAPALGELDQTGENPWLCGDDPDGDAAPVAEFSTPPEPRAAAAAALTSLSASNPCAQTHVEIAFGIAQIGREVVVSHCGAVLAGLPRDVFARSPGISHDSVPGSVSEPARAIPLAALPADVFARRHVDAAASAPATAAQATNTCSSASPPSPHPAASRSSNGPRFGHALDLTRQALFEWMNVLTGPAVVELP
jgi:hypothetical protein